MAPPPRRRANRLLLWTWVVLSLVSVGYSLVLVAFSVPVTEAIARDMAHADASTLRTSERLVVVGLTGPGDVVTLSAATDERAFGGPGHVLYYSTRNETIATAPLLPFQAPPGRVARALAYVERNETTGNWDAPQLRLENVTSLALVDVPTPNATADGYGARNVTLDLSTFEGDKGFIVKADAADAPHPALVPVDRVVGRAERAVPASSVWLSLSLSVLGTLVPLILIVTTHRGRGQAGIPGAGGATGPACPECGRPAVEGTGFCVRCGADLKPR